MKKAETKVAIAQPTMSLESVNALLADGWTIQGAPVSMGNSALLVLRREPDVLTVQKLLGRYNELTKVGDTKWRWVKITREELNELYADPVFQRVNTNMPEELSAIASGVSASSEERINFVGTISLIAIFVEG
ncbi:MAG: hypothetical protein PVSMB8_07440 [Vulcanimicrobiaceae bacterium]